MSHCLKCLKEFDIHYKRAFCSCGGLLNDSQIPDVTNTRDSFGIGKEFIHKDKNGVSHEINNWRQWERAGYMNPLQDSSVPSEVKNEIKRKVEKIEKYDTRKRFSVMT